MCVCTLSWKDQIIKEALERSAESVSNLSRENPPNERSANLQGQSKFIAGIAYVFRRGVVSVIVGSLLLGAQARMPSGPKYLLRSTCFFGGWWRYVP